MAKKVDMTNFRIKDTLPDGSWDRLFSNQEVVGIFETLFDPDVVAEPYGAYAYQMCLEYYTVHSGNKKVSPLFQIYNNYVWSYYAYTSQKPTWYVICESVNNRIASMLRAKYSDKWLRVYSTLLKSEYDALAEYEHNETKIGNDTDTTQYDLTLTTTGTNTDTVTYNSATEDNGKTGSRESRVTQTDSAEGVYGFNADNASGSNTDSEVVNETIVSDPEYNTNYNKSVKSGDDTTVQDTKKSELKQGSESKTFGVNETITKNGRNATGASLINAELSMRNKQIFFEIIFKDIDSIATRPTY